MTGSAESSLSRHAGSRRNVSAEPAPDEAAIAEFPGLRFVLHFPSGRPVRSNWAALEPAGFVEQVARIVWRMHHEGIAFRSGSPVYALQKVLADFNAYLCKGSRISEIGSVSDIKREHIDGLEAHLRADENVNEDAVGRRMSAFTRIISHACKYGLKISDDVKDRCQYVLATGDRPPRTGRRDAYPDKTMNEIRRLARQEMKCVVVRLYLGRRIGRKQDRPRVVGRLKTSFETFIWDVFNSGFPGPAASLRAGYAGRKQGWTHKEAYRAVFLHMGDLVCLMILLLDATGLPPECVTALKANCLSELNPTSGQALLRYVKRRQTQDDSEQAIVVSTVGRYSPGYLVRRILQMTSPARRLAGFKDNEGPLFLARSRKAIRRVTLNDRAMEAYGARNPVAVGDEGAMLERVHLSLIRKTVKARRWITTGGDLEATGGDHSVKTLIRHYVLIPHLHELHEQVAAEGISELFETATAPRLLDKAASRAFSDNPTGFAKSLGIELEQALDTATDANDVWVGGCLGISKGSRDIRPCGAPVWGCLNCANAIFTYKKIPGLVRLLNHIINQRQKMSLDVWSRQFGVSYSRVRQILNHYPPEDVRAAIEDAAGSEELDFTFAQLIYRID